MIKEIQTSSPLRYLCVEFLRMKRTHIIILIGIAALITGLIVFSAGDLSTYDTIVGAKKKTGKGARDLHIIAKLDKTRAIEYDPIRNPNYLSFYAVDSLGGNTKVIYRKGKPGDLEKSERLVMVGNMEADHFECSDILLKCPSKYKDDKKQLEKTVTDQTSTSN